jgi:hypothetical protein
MIGVTVLSHIRQQVHSTLHSDVFTGSTSSFTDSVAGASGGMDKNKTGVAFVVAAMSRLENRELGLKIPDDRQLPSFLSFSLALRFLNS